MTTNDRTDEPGSHPHPCAHAWCTTPHGSTSHPDDEQHRSAGVATRLRLRDPWSFGAVPFDLDVEVGVVARTDDDEPWFAIESSDGRVLEVPAATIRGLVALLRSDDALSEVLGLTAASPHS